METSPVGECSATALSDRGTRLNPCRSWGNWFVVG